MHYKRAPLNQLWLSCLLSWIAVAHVVDQTGTTLPSSMPPMGPTLPPVVHRRWIVGPSLVITRIASMPLKCGSLRMLMQLEALV